MFISGLTDIYLNIFLMIVLVIALAIDMRIYKIPNLITYPAMCTALFYHTMLSGTGGFFFSLLGLVTGVGIFSLPFILGFMGAGDVKLMGAIGAAIGVRGVINACVFTSLAGGLLAFVLLLAHNRSLNFVGSYAAALRASIGERRVITVPPAAQERKPKVYYALAIAVGTIYTILWKAAFSCYPL